jgi:sarcosine oxidase, subunit beta
MKHTVKSSSATAIIIGGGVIGLSTAYHLAKKDFGKIILLEKNTVGDGSSSRAGGIITGLLWGKTGIEARKISLKLYRELSIELASYGYQFQDVGCLNLFDQASWSDREKLLPLYDECDVPYEIIDAKEIRHRWSDLTPTEDMVGLYDPLGGYSEPDQYVPALAQRCRDLSVDIRENQTVTDFLLDHNRVSGVITIEGQLKADVVISTVHTWTNKLLDAKNEQLPIKSFVHQRYLTKPLENPIHIPAVNANPHGGYVRPATGNRILVGGETEEREEFITPSLDFRMTNLLAPDGYKDQLRNNIIPLLPKLRETQWESEKIGLLSFSIDGEPIVGSVPQLEGLLMGASFHSGGFAYNPVAGLLLAELAMDGKTQLDIGAFSPRRFESTATSDYLSTRVAQKDAVSRRH